MPHSWQRRAVRMYCSPGRAALNCWFIGRSLSDSLAIWIVPRLRVLASRQPADDASGFRCSARRIAPVFNLSALCQELRQIVPRFPFRYFFFRCPVQAQLVNRLRLIPALSATFIWQQRQSDCYFPLLRVQIVAFSPAFKMRPGDYSLRLW